MLAAVQTFNCNGSPFILCLWKGWCSPFHFNPFSQLTSFRYRSPFQIQSLRCAWSVAAVIVVRFPLSNETLVPLFGPERVFWCRHSSGRRWRADPSLLSSATSGTLPTASPFSRCSNRIVLAMKTRLSKLCGFCIFSYASSSTLYPCQ